MVKKSTAFITALLSATAIYFLDYFVWVKYPEHPVMDALVVGLAVLAIGYFGMTSRK